MEVAIVIVWTHTHTDRMPFAKGLYSTLKVPASLTKKILIKGTPLLLNETLWAAGMAILTQCYSVRGLNVVAAQNIANTINNVFNVVFIALGDSVAIVVGQLLGAGDMKKARDTDNKMIAFSVMCCTGVAIVMLVVAPFFPRLYKTNQDARELAKYFIMIMAIFMPQNAFLHAAYFTLRSGGKTINKIIADTGVKIDINDDGRVFILSPDQEASAAAKKMIDNIVKDIEVGEVFLGKVVNILPIGAQVELKPGKKGLVHISKLANRRVEKVEDVVSLGDEILVRVIDIKPDGKIDLTRKGLLPEDKQN